MAFSLIDSVAVASNGRTGTTGAIDTTGADLLVAVTVSYDGSSIESFTDSKSNTWTPRTRYGNHARVKIYYSVPSSVGSGHTFSIDDNPSVSSFPAICVAAFSGSHATPFDQENGADAAAPGSVTPSENNELLVTGICWYPGGSLSVDGGFTITDEIAYNGASNMGACMAYLIQTSAASANPTWSRTGGFTERGAAIATFKAEAVAPSTNRRRRVILTRAA